MADGKNEREYGKLQRGPAGRYGLAVDFGTGTVRGQLVDRESGDAVASASVPNRLSAFGKDILTRVAACAENAERREAAFDAAAGSVSDLLLLLSERSGTDVSAVPETVLAANTTHLYLLLRRDPGCLVHPPYVFELHDPGTLSVTEHGLPLKGDVFFAPCPANYLGGDALCAVLASGIHRREKAALLDLGVNGEYVLRSGGTLFAGSCAAGCALDAESGNFSASELVAAIHGLRSSGLLNGRGRLPRDGDPRVTEVRRPGAARPVPAAEAGGRLLLQPEIADFIQAKASVATMTDYIREAAGLGEEEPEETVLTGALGCALDPEAARAVGLLGGGEHVKREDLVLAGARRLLLDVSARTELEEIRSRIRYVQLREVEDYLELMIPHLRLG